jgi:hypothetical protein
MNISRTLRFILASVLVVGFSTAGFGQATRTWVSGVGNDANPCSRTAPCKTFAGAISKTADKGEISVLDPGGFGTVTIGKGITINGTGTLAGILNSVGTTGIIVNATPTDTVIIREVSIAGAGTGANGVSYTGGKTLMIDHCWIYGQNNSATSRGINVNKTASGNLEVINTIIENVNEDGIHATTSSGVLVVTVDNSAIMNCGQDGIEAVANVRGGIVNSRIAVNAGNGVSASGANTQVNIDDAFINFNELVGIRASAGSALRVSDTIVANNGTGMLLNGGIIDSFQGNSVFGNNVVGSAFSSTTLKQ